MKNKIFYIFAFFLSLSFFFSIDNVKALNSGSNITNCVGIEWDAEKQDWLLYYNNYKDYGLDLTSNSYYESFRQKKINGEDVYITVVDTTKNSNYDYYGLSFIFTELPLKYAFPSKSIQSDHLWVGSMYVENEDTTNKFSYYKLTVLKKDGSKSIAYSNGSSNLRNESVIRPANKAILYANYDIYKSSSWQGYAPTEELLVESSFFNQNICEACSIALSNPTFSNKYIIGEIPNYDEEQNVASLLDIDFGVYDTSKYYYYISTDSAQTWQNVTSYMTDSHFTHTMVKNGTVIAKIVSKSSGNEASSSYTVTGITEEALLNFIKWEVLETEEDYVYINNIKYRKRVDLYAYFNYYNSEGFKYYISLDNGITFDEIDSSIYNSYFYKNMNVIAKITDKYENYIYSSSYSVTGLTEIQELGQDIVFSESCYDRPWEDDNISSVNERRCTVSLEFLNANDENYNYYIKAGSDDYFQVTMSDLNFNVYRNDTNVITTLCGRVTDKNNNVIIEKCYINTGFEIDETFFDKVTSVFSNFRNNIIEIFKVFTNFYNGLPVGVQNMFYLCLFIILAIYIFKFLI